MGCDTSSGGEWEVVSQGMLSKLTFLDCLKEDLGFD